MSCVVTIFDGARCGCFEILVWLATRGKAGMGVLVGSWTRMELARCVERSKKGVIDNSLGERIGRCAR